MATKVHSSPRLHAPPPTLSPVERELVCAVLEDCVDQLAVLGGIMPNYAEKPSAVEKVREQNQPINLSNFFYFWEGE